MSGFDISNLTQGIPTNVGLVIKNNGDQAVSITNSIVVPEDWDVVEPTINYDLAPGEEMTARFSVIPSEKSGEIEIATSYESRSRFITFTNSTDVYVNILEVMEQDVGYVGALLASLQNPLFLITFTGAGVAVAVFVGTKLGIISQIIPQQISNSVPRNTVRNSKPSKAKKINQDYNKWEHSLKKRG